MNVIITGGTGMIGTALAQSLLNDGHEVNVLSRSPDRKQSLVPEGAKVVGWDSETPQGWGDLVEEADAVVNFAGMGLDGGSFIPKRWTPARKDIILNSRLKSGQAVAEAIRGAKKKPSLLVQASASGYYGTTLSDEVKTEESPAGDDFLAQVCVQWEAATEPVEDMGVRRVVLRSGLILDDEQGALPRLALPFKLFAGGPIGSGDQYYPWIHLEDLIRAIRYLMEKGEESGPFNLSAPEPVTNRELAHALGEALNRPAYLPAPAFALRLALGEVATLVLEGQRMIPSRLQAAGFSFNYPTLDGALRDLYR